MGVNAMPFNLWRLRNPSKNKASFVFSQSLGIFLAGTTVYLGFAFCQKVRRKRSPLHPHIRPAFLSGCIWSLGFLCSCVAIDSLGFTVAYPLSAVLPTFTSSLVSLFYFREIRRKSQVALFWLCSLIQATGVVLIAAGT